MMIPIRCAPADEKRKKSNPELLNGCIYIKMIEMESINFLQHAKYAIFLFVVKIIRFFHSRFMAINQRSVSISYLFMWAVFFVLFVQFLTASPKWYRVCCKEVSFSLFVCICEQCELGPAIFLRYNFIYGAICGCVAPSNYCRFFLHNFRYCSGTQNSSIAQQREWFVVMNRMPNRRWTFDRFSSEHCCIVHFL